MVSFSAFPPFKVAKALYSKKPLIHTPVYTDNYAKFGKVSCSRTQTYTYVGAGIRTTNLPVKR